MRMWLLVLLVSQTGIAHADAPEPAVLPALTPRPPPPPASDPLRLAQEKVRTGAVLMGVGSAVMVAGSGLLVGFLTDKSPCEGTIGYCVGRGIGEATFAETMLLSGVAMTIFGIAKYARGAVSKGKLRSSDLALGPRGFVF